MSILTFFLGKKGATGETGLDGVGSEDVRTVLLDNPLFSGFHSNKLSFAPVSWSREASASITDRYGNLAFVGGDTRENLLSYSEDFSQWSDTSNYWNITNSSANDPLGGVNAKTIKLDSATFPSGIDVMGIPYVIASAGVYTFSFWIRTNVGVVDNVGVQFEAGGTVFTLSDPVTSDYQRISITQNVFAPVTDSFYINVYGALNIEFDIFGAQLSEDTQVVDYVKTTGSSIDEANPELRQRANQLGYLIEYEKDNISPYSEDLLGASWTVTGGNITAYSGANPKNTTGSNIQVNFDSPNCVLADTGAYTEGETYTVSFWLYNDVNTIDSAVVAVGGGAQVAIDEISTTGFVRVFVSCVAGNANGLSITLTAGDLTAKTQVFGVQSELGDLSSYIATIDNAATRTPDLVALDYPQYFPLPSGQWSYIFTHAIEESSDNDRYLFHNGLSGSDEFSGRISGDTTYIVNGDTESLFAKNNGNFEFVFDGSNLKLYSDAIFISESAVVNPCSVVGTTMFLFSDELQTNQLASFVADVYFFDKALTIDEIRYLRGTDS